jgi:hypothetical protein
MGSVKCIPPPNYAALGGGAWFIRAVLQLCRYAKWRGKCMLNLKALFLLVYLDIFPLAF